jgi:N-methylhydantoinase B
VSGAILTADPTLMPASTGGTMVTVSLAEIAADGFSRVIEAIEPLRGGMGAFDDRDGVDARDNSLNNMRNHPLEMVEAQSSLRVIDYDIRPDSGGPGRWRGGVGQSITMEVLCDGGSFLARGLDRMRLPAWGVAGGRPGTRLQAILNRGRPDERRLGKIHELHASRGDTLTLNLPGGGGYGDPFTRDPERVLFDWERGFVTTEGAYRDYGVAITGDGRIDAAATADGRARKPNHPTGFFDFGPDRRAWEAVFSDAVMSELNQRLYALPKAIRQDVRRDLFEAAVPGISRPDGRSFAELIPDPAASSQRLRDALDRLAV